MPKNKKIILDLNKCQSASLVYRNQDVMLKLSYPIVPTVHGMWFEPNGMAATHPLYPGESNMQRARRLKVLDIWIPECKFIMASNHSVTYTGKKALEMYKAWSAKIFGKQNKRKK